MKKALTSHWKTCAGSFACAFVLSTSVFADNHEPTTLELKSDEQKTGYSYGQMFGRRLSGTMTDIDIDAFLAGIRDAYSGQASKLTEQQISEALQTYQNQQLQKQKEQQQALATENLAKGKSFLAENAGKEGVLTTGSGLQYKILTEGEGVSPKLTDTVEVHYTGSLISGEVFDSSVQRGSPVSFPVNGVIAGWIEALQLMKPGGKWQLFIPANLAYGPTGNGRIGPNETLIFEVELLAVK
jgi:FKBP-type peptidyl-prolyl cis-trans isomerase FklB